MAYMGTEKINKLVEDMGDEVAILLIEFQKLLQNKKKINSYIVLLCYLKYIEKDMNKEILSDFRDFYEKKNMQKFFNNIIKEK